MKMRRVLPEEFPVGWVALGVVALLAMPPVRRALRLATVSAAVGVLKLTDGIKDMGGKVMDQTGQIMADATQKKEEWTAAAKSEPPTSKIRQTVISGLASTLSAVDAVSESAKRMVPKRPTFANAEFGSLGEDHTNERDAMLPDHLLPKTSSSYQAQNRQPSGHVPEDFAVRKTDALLSFVDDVNNVGATFKPEYKQMLNDLRDE